MKLSDAITEFNLTGLCQIDVDKAVKCFGKATIISRWHEKYTLVNKKARVKVQIPIESVNQLVDKLGLVELKSGIFANASTFMRPKRAC